MRDVKCEQEASEKSRKKSHRTQVRARQEEDAPSEVTHSTGWKHKTHSLPLNHSIFFHSPGPRFLVDRLFCASRLLLQNTSMLFKYNDEQQRQKFSKAPLEHGSKKGARRIFLFFFSSHIHWMRNDSFRWLSHDPKRRVLLAIRLRLLLFFFFR